MEERIAQTISRIANWEELASFESNVRARNLFTDEIAEGLRQRSIELAKTFIAEKTALNLTTLSPIEEKIVRAVGEYVAIKKRQGKYPHRTLEQLKHRGLLGAVEKAVCRKTPTQGYQILADASLKELSYEQIVIDHSDDFSPRAVWYSRRTLGLPNTSNVPPLDTSGDTPIDDIQSGPDTEKRRNPPWSRDELILAIDLYLRHRESPPGKDSEEVVELSHFLNRMGHTLGLIENDTYRNANGVYMKMMNFRHHDPEYIKDGKVGLTRGNSDEAAVWLEFSADRARLTEVVTAIRATIAAHEGDHELVGDDEPDIQEAEEGRVLTRLHRVRERNRKLIEAKKKLALKETGQLICEACGFNFVYKYGPSTKGVIDVHHTKPVHTLSEGDKTRLEDLVLLCANCHRVVHSARKWLTIEQLKSIIADH